MERRLRLQALLEAIPGVAGVYFQPPETIKMEYPAIRYSLDNYWGRRADNKRYLGKKRYNLIVIDYDPDSIIPDQVIQAFEYCSLDRWYKGDNLNHWSLTLYY